MPDSIVVTRTVPEVVLDRLRSAGNLWVWPHDRDIDLDVLRRRLVDAHGLYCMHEDPVDAELLDVAPKLRAVSTMAVGVDNIDLDACRQRGISVGHTPDVLTDSTADMAWTLLMASSRRLAEGVAYIRSGSWDRFEPRALLGQDITGSTLGVIGMGRIGQAVARRSTGFDMPVLYASRSPVPEIKDDVGAERVGLVDLFARSDHVVVCVPLTEDTEGLIGSEALRLMKPTANLVNISRGPVVDTDALVEALSTGQIRCAGLDVTDPEPIPQDHPLVHLPNCTIVPHVGSATERTRLAMADLAADNLIAGLAGRPMPSSVV
ncbi:MAG: 2-hydroxyacid dehydrogenase [Acidimicrobiia bacterium]